MSGQNAAKRDDLEGRLLDFVAQVTSLVEGLPSTATGNDVFRQLLRSSGSPLAHYEAARAAESAGKRVESLRACLDGLRQSYRWLRLVRRVPLVGSASAVDPLLEEADGLIHAVAGRIRAAEGKTA